MEVRAILTDRLAQVEERLHAACGRAGRARTEVTLIAVTKTVHVATARALLELGVVHLGENRPQELWRKAGELPPLVHWHLIGHLQRNKIERTLPLVEMIHSVDSLRLLQALEQEAVRQQRQVGRIANPSHKVPVLLEVNVSGEASKHGFAPPEVAAVLPHLLTLQRVQVRGLMTLAAYEDDPQRCRPTFAGLRQLAERLRSQLPPGHTLDQLSMGMSNDFEIAVEEGATLVRLGTVLLEGLGGQA